MIFHSKKFVFKNTDGTISLPSIKSDKGIYLKADLNNSGAILIGEYPIESGEILSLEALYGNEITFRTLETTNQILYSLILSNNISVLPKYDPHKIINIKNKNGLALVTCETDISGLLVNEDHVVLPEPYGFRKVTNVNGSIFYAEQYITYLENSIWTKLIEHFAEYIFNTIITPTENWIKIIFELNGLGSDGEHNVCTLIPPFEEQYTLEITQQPGDKISVSGEDLQYCQAINGNDTSVQATIVVKYYTY